MTEPLPNDEDCYGYINYDKETDEDWYEGCCIEKGFVQGLDAESAEGHKQCGDLVVKDTNGIIHTFKIHLTHQCLIFKDVYTLLGDRYHQAWALGR